MESPTENTSVHTEKSDKIPSLCVRVTQKTVKRQTLNVCTPAIIHSLKMTLIQGDEKNTTQK